MVCGCVSVHLNDQLVHWLVRFEASYGTTVMYDEWWFMGHYQVPDMTLTQFWLCMAHNMQRVNSSPPWCCIYASVNWASIGSGNGLSPVRRQAITWTRAGLLSIGLNGNEFQWNSNRNSVIFIQENAFEIVICQNDGHFVQGEMS